ncbi:hypothetical protein B296_00053645 [Ensete ventricosum]|uniref:Uncharacterized protein n=1 Tax=Ensete ventricosum TaxID=4639 RepID=A0A426Y5D6_ENSVE|nr:hypothetical protein B296_00053645 [Ensete ventricosum]
MASFNLAPNLRIKSLNKFSHQLYLGPISGLVRQVLKSALGRDNGCGDPDKKEGAADSSKQRGPARKKKWEQQGPTSNGVRRGVAATAGDSWAKLLQDEEGAAGGDCDSEGGWLQREEDEEGAAGGEGGVRGEEDGRMGAATEEEGATVVDAGVAATMWLKHGCAPTGCGYRWQMGAKTPMTEARMRCSSRKRR